MKQCATVCREASNGAHSFSKALRSLKYSIIIIFSQIVSNALLFNLMVDCALIQLISQIVDPTISFIKRRCFNYFLQLS